MSSHDSNIVPVQHENQYHPISQSQQIVPVEDDRYDTIPEHGNHNYLPNQPEVLKYSSNNEIIPNIMNDLTSDMSIAERLSNEINKVCSTGPNI